MGYLENIYEDEKSAAISYAMTSSFGVGNSYFGTGKREGYVDTIVFGAYRKKIFEEIGLFDEELERNQDDEFNFRILKNGYKLLLTKEIRSKYYVRSTFRKLFKQYFMYGYWKIYVNKKHNTITTIRQLAPSFFICFIIFGLLISLFNKKMLIIYSFILLIYILLSIANSIKYNNKIRQIFNTIFSFYILHISYGIGYLTGIFHILILRKKPLNIIK